MSRMAINSNEVFVKNWRIVSPMDVRDKCVVLFDIRVNFSVETTDLVLDAKTYAKRCYHRIG